MASGYDAALKLFQDHDKNKDGVLSKVELKNILSAASGKSWSDADIDKMFLAADANNDGQVDMEEFLQWMFGVAQVGACKEGTPIAYGDVVCFKFWDASVMEVSDKPMLCVCCKKEVCVNKSEEAEEYLKFSGGRLELKAESKSVQQRSKHFVIMNAFAQPIGEPVHGADFCHIKSVHSGKYVSRDYFRSKDGPCEEGVLGEDRCHNMCVSSPFDDEIDSWFVMTNPVAPYDCDKASQEAIVSGATVYLRTSTICINIGDTETTKTTVQGKWCAAPCCNCRENYGRQPCIPFNKWQKLQIVKLDFDKQASVGARAEESRKNVEEEEKAQKQAEEARIKAEVEAVEKAKRPEDEANQARRQSVFMLKSVRSNLHLHVAAEHVKPNDSVVQSNSTTDGSKWYVEGVKNADGQGVIMLQNVRSGHYLCVDGTKDGGPVMQGTATEGAQWLVEPCAAVHTVMFKSLHSKHYLHVPPEHQKPAISWHSQSDGSQWLMEPCSAG